MFLPNAKWHIVYCLLILSLLSCADDMNDVDGLSEDPDTEESPVYGVQEVNITHDGQERSYLLYIPNSYDGASDVPLLFNFHGFTSNAREQMAYGDFRAIAEREGFIIAHPEGLRFNGSTHWNVGGWTVGSQVDDVDFTLEMIEDITSEYNIDQNRIYSTGMSNGGYMSFLLACQLSDKIAAIASVTGSMTPQTFDDCNPQHPTPILQIHGTQDVVVPYDGSSWTKSIDDVMAYWVTYNSCNGDADQSDIPDVDTSDNSSVEEFTYQDCNKNIITKHLKVEGGGHTWAGSEINVGGTNYDINASELIWEFLSQYDLEELSSE